MARVFHLPSKSTTPAFRSSFLSRCGWRKNQQASWRDKIQERGSSWFLSPMWTRELDLEVMTRAGNEWVKSHWVLCQVWIRIVLYYPRAQWEMLDSVSEQFKEKSQGNNKEKKQNWKGGRCGLAKTHPSFTWIKIHLQGLPWWSVGKALRLHCTGWGNEDPAHHAYDQK